MLTLHHPIFILYFISKLINFKVKRIPTVNLTVINSSLIN